MNERCMPDIVLSVHREAKKDAGEDSFCYCFGSNAGMLGVFDGCGGLGAQRHSCYSGKTEAFMASRFCAGAFFDSFKATFPSNRSVTELAEKYCSAAAAACSQMLKVYRPHGENESPRVKGSMVRTLPSTAAVALIQLVSPGKHLICPIWAGDSRVYILTKDGLAQLTVDDTTVPDPMENLYEDGILKNILCEGVTPRLHMTQVLIEEPFLIFSATDGCFGYYSTPMEFEGILLDTLLTAKNGAEWEKKLSLRIGEVAGDDYTFCLVSFGYQTFSALQESFTERYRFLYDNFLNMLQYLPNEDREIRRQMWEHYKPQYYRYIKEK